MLDRYRPGVDMMPLLYQMIVLSNVIVGSLEPDFNETSGALSRAMLRSFPPGVCSGQENPGEIRSWNRA